MHEADVITGLEMIENRPQMDIGVLGVFLKHVLESVVRRRLLY
jgi:hypothetical protein